ncbi:MAG: EAL domain-containing protein, partial [Lachnospiraceae bacterium]|nr:EAL domain-containing protein [Lachnospiraceae bacterium]
MTKRKKVALLTGEVEETYQSDVIRGFKRVLNEADIDVYVFAMLQKYQDTEERAKSDFGIFDLVPYDSLDGIVILCDTVQTKDGLSNLYERLREDYKGAVLLVDGEKMYPSQYSHTYNAIRALLDHLVQEHGIREIAFLNGRKEHPHAIQRLADYKKALEDLGIPVDENLIFQGDFWYTSGDTMVEEIKHHGRKFPRAVLCANDCMAVGLCKALEAYGLRVPEDVAVVAYDSAEDGQCSPVPITGAYIRGEFTGSLAGENILALMEGRPVKEGDAPASLFLGESCGCKNPNCYMRDMRRTTWESQFSRNGFHAGYSHYLDDLQGQSEVTDFVNAIYSYLFQIGSYRRFFLCLNKEWQKPDQLDEEAMMRIGFSSQMIKVMDASATGETPTKIGFDDVFKKSDVLPEDAWDYPEAGLYFISPLFFANHTMGYVAVRYAENGADNYDMRYHMWLSMLCNGMESLRRAVVAKNMNPDGEVLSGTDPLTGLYNYYGFVDEAKVIMEKNPGNPVSFYAMVVDMCNTASVNEKYGRKEGDRRIKVFGKMLQELEAPDVFMCRIGNDEFVVGTMEHSLGLRMKEIESGINKALEIYNKDKDEDMQLHIYAVVEHDKVSNSQELEQLISRAVSIKNGNKVLERKMEDRRISPQEDAQMHLVAEILDRNLLTYYFQPIVSAVDGSIFAYEALMRATTEQRISPLDIIKYADHIGRLNEVEKYTFINVLERVNLNKERFQSAKVFINSIPGVRLGDDDQRKVHDMLMENMGRIVLELTEQAELNDEELQEMKDRYATEGMETAVDDYGTGYSNVTNLLRYMPRYVKIDRMLLSGIQDNPQKQHFVREIIDFSHANDIVTLAEGIETTEELETVIRLGADLIQGYYTARP